jgi:hypothetical protein
MQITNLSYLEIVLEADSVSGKAGVLVDAFAFSTGISTYTLANTHGTARMLPSGVSIARGRGFAVAIGDDPVAGVSVYGEGDIVVGKTKTRYFPNRNMTVSRGFVIAIEKP